MSHKMDISCCACIGIIPLLMRVLVSPRDTRESKTALLSASPEFKRRSSKGMLVHASFPTSLSHRLGSWLASSWRYLGCECYPGLEFHPRGSRCVEISRSSWVVGRFCRISYTATQGPVGSGASAPENQKSPRSSWWRSPHSNGTANGKSTRTRNSSSDSTYNSNSNVLVTVIVISKRWAPRRSSR